MTREDRSIDLSSKVLVINEKQGRLIFNFTLNTRFSKNNISFIPA